MGDWLALSAFDHPHAVSRLMDHVEERLARPDREALEQHLGDCPRCVEFLESYRRTPDIVPRNTGVRVPSRVSRQLRVLFDQIGRRDHRRRRELRKRST